MDISISLFSLLQWIYLGLYVFSLSLLSHLLFYYDGIVIKDPEEDAAGYTFTFCHFYCASPMNWMLFKMLRSKNGFIILEIESEGKESTLHHSNSYLHFVISLQLTLIQLLEIHIYSRLPGIWN